jgi:PIN domain nuclease of toxin-antitoxin system
MEIDPIRDWLREWKTKRTRHRLPDRFPEHVFLAEEHRFSRDPFDGLIVATAEAMDLPLISRDTAIQESGLVKAVW